MTERSLESMLLREEVANRPKHWVRCVTACNSKCIFCLDSDTPRNVYLPEDDVKAEILRGRTEFDAWKVILSGGEGSLHPKFTEFVRHAREIGYGRVQTVTNGWRFAEREFFDACVVAGLGEITFSLHGHTAELHDRLTQTPGAFRRIVKAILRAVRTPGLIVSVDVCINKQNVAVLDKIVELSLSLGVSEFDLLHVIPQASAYDNRHELFYDPRDHIDVLHRVFNLGRHPGVTIWTNRFPINYLEGLEDLIQDPHKMLDEVNGRRWLVRRYLDTGKPLDCRQPERCVHCFIEPFCTSADRVIEMQRRATCEIWWVGEEEWRDPLPFGATRLGVRVREPAALASLTLPDGAGLYAEVLTAGPLPELAGRLPVTLVCDTPAHLDAWLGTTLPEGVDLEVHLGRETAEWLLAHRDTLAAGLDHVRLHQPSHEHMRDAVARDVRGPRGFFERLALPVRVSGLPVCQTPGAIPVEELARLDREVFDPTTGRLDIRELARHHVARRYRGKSLRCRDCRVDTRCEGLPINMIRDQGLALVTPLIDGDEAERGERELRALRPEPLARLANARPPEAPAPSLPGFPMPVSAPLDPLAVIQIEQVVRRERRLKLLRGGGVEPSGN